MSKYLILLRYELDLNTVLESKDSLALAMLVEKHIDSIRRKLVAFIAEFGKLSREPYERDEY